MMRKFNRGITLIALVVTIIVLLILAGISITMLTGQNGIINRAQEAKEKAETANDNEQRKLAQAEALMNTEITTYKGVNLPEGFAPTKIEGENSLDDGLVITDAKGNEFIWIEVPKTTSVYSTAGLNITDFTYDEYTKIETDLQTYTKDYRNGTTYNDVYYPDDTNGWFTETGDTSYDMAKKKMLKSVYQNGGFWVGRYEVGIDVNKEDSRVFSNGECNIEHIASQTPVIKKNAYPYNWVTRTQAQTLAYNFNNSHKYNSSLLYGIQWDLMTTFICKSGKIDNLLLLSDSTTIGNYKNNLWNINNNAAKYIEDGGMLYKNCPYKKISNSSLLLTTGADDKFSIMNIYDVAGNVWEWTMESNQANESFEIYRGGSFNNEGDIYFATIKDHYRAGYKNSANIGFRITLY